MKKIALFVSDIQGTLPATENGENAQSIKVFFNTLNELGEKLGAEEILFSLSSTVDKENVLKKLKELVPYMKGSKISLGNQYSETEAFDYDGNVLFNYEKGKAKLELMAEEAANLQANNNEIVWMGFADDLGEIYPDVITPMFPEIPITLIYPEFPNPLPFDTVISEIQEVSNTLGEEHLLKQKK